MGLFAWFLLSGASYAAGNLLLIAATGLSFLYEKKLCKALVRICFILGTVFVLFSPVIMPQAIIAVMILSLFSLFFALQLGARKMGFTHIVRGLLVVCAGLALFNEVKYWKAPGSAEAQGKIFVMGGSMSAVPKDSKIKTWPAILKEGSNLEILDYSVAGALAKQYPERADVIYGDNIIVILECGTDDIHYKTPLSEYRRSLDALLAKLVKPGRTVFILEIPEYPATRGAYSKTLRESAEKFGARIIPKRLLTGIESKYKQPDMSLSQEGHEKMAGLIKSFITESPKPPNKDTIK